MICWECNTVLLYELQRWPLFSKPLCFCQGWTTWMLWDDLEDAWRKTCQIFRKWIKTSEKGEYFANCSPLNYCQSFPWEWRLNVALNGVVDANVEKHPPTRPYCLRTCVESFRGKNGKKRKRRQWRGLLDRSTMRTSEDKVSVLSSFTHSCNKLWVMVPKMCVCCFLLFYRGSRARCGLFFFLPWWRTTQEAKRNSRHAPRPGEHPAYNHWCDVEEREREKEITQVCFCRQQSSAARGSN